jgi:hypothetical protein
MSVSVLDLSLGRYNNYNISQLMYTQMLGIVVGRLQNLLSHKFYMLMELQIQTNDFFSKYHIVCSDTLHTNIRMNPQFPIHELSPHKHNNQIPVELPMG